jgi:hypothetical protein
VQHRVRGTRRSTASHIDYTAALDRSTLHPLLLILFALES